MKQITSFFTVRVRYSDTDRMGVAYHSRYFEWFESGRTELFRDLGLPYIEMEERGIRLPVVEASIRYRISAKYDDLIKIESSVNEMPRSIIKFNYKVFNSDSGILLAEGFTTHCFLKDNGRPSKIPHFFQILLSERLNEKI